MTQEQIKRIIENEADLGATEDLSEELNYSIKVEGPFFTNSQMGGHIFFDGDVRDHQIIEMSDGHRIIYTKPEDLSSYIYKSEEEFIEWFEENKKENYAVLVFDDITNYDEEVGSIINSIIFEQNDKYFIIDYASLENLIKFNEENDDDFNNALSLKK